MVYVLLGAGFEETEAITPVDLMRRAGIKVLTVGIGSKTVCGGHGIPVCADITLEEMDPTDLEMIVLPGGLGGVASIQASQGAMDAIRFAWDNKKYVAAICAAPTILGSIGITAGREVTCYPGCEAQLGNADIVELASVQDGTLITGTSAGCAVSFGLQLISALKGPDAANAVAEQIVIR